MSKKSKPWWTWDDCATRYHEAMRRGDAAMLQGIELAEGTPGPRALRDAAAAHANAAVYFSQAARISLFHIGHPEPFWEPARRAVRAIRAWWSQ